jgi:serine/threonine protein kinase
LVSVIHDTVGHGSYGKVKRCLNTTDGLTYAAKIVNKSILKRKRVGRFGTALDSVKKELAIWKKLNHENIVHLVEVIDDPGNPSFISRFTT